MPIGWPATTVWLRAQHARGRLSSSAFLSSRRRNLVCRCRLKEIAEQAQKVVGYRSPGAYPAFAVRERKNKGGRFSSYAQIDADFDTVLKPP
jgi:hypothetical protein